MTGRPPMHGRRLLLVLDVSAEAAAHAAVALRWYRRRAATDTPPELQELEVMLAERSTGVCGGQAGSSLDDVSRALETQVVKPTTLSYADAGRWLGVSGSSVKRLVRSGELSPVHIGGSVRLAVDDLQAFLDQQRRKAAS